MKNCTNSPPVQNYFRIVVVLMLTIPFEVYFHMFSLKFYKLASDVPELSRRYITFSTAHTVFRYVSFTLEDHWPVIRKMWGNPCEVLGINFWKKVELLSDSCACQAFSYSELKTQRTIQCCKRRLQR